MTVPTPRPRTPFGFSATAMSAMRPPMSAGPIDRNVSDRTNTESGGIVGSDAPRAAGLPARDTRCALAAAGTRRNNEANVAPVQRSARDKGGLEIMRCIDAQREGVGREGTRKCTPRTIALLARRTL